MDVLLSFFVRLCMNFCYISPKTYIARAISTYNFILRSPCIITSSPNIGWFIKRLNCQRTIKQEQFKILYVACNINVEKFLYIDNRRHFIRAFLNTSHLSSRCLNENWVIWIMFNVNSCDKIFQLFYINAKYHDSCGHPTSNSLLYTVQCIYCPIRPRFASNNY